MSILAAGLRENPCYGVNSEGVEYLEFACVHGMETYYAGYVPVQQWLQQQQ
jgi:hypothetical protein